MSILNDLHGCPLFYDLSKDEIISLIGKTSIKFIKKNELLFNEGESIDSFYIILKGNLSAYKSIENKDNLVIFDLKEHDYFGEFLFSNETVHPYNVVASSDSEILMIKFKHFLEVYKKRPETFSIFLMNLMRQEQEKLRISLGLISRVRRDTDIPLGLPLFGIKRLRREDIEKIKKRKAS